MASDFEQFMNRMLGQAMPQAPQVPVAPTPQPMMPTPQAPAQSAYSSPMPAQLAQLIERAAQMAQAQRPAPQTDSQFYTQALQSQGVDPRASASTAPVQGPTAPVTQPTAVSQPVRQAEPTGYLLVQLQPQEGDQGMQGQMVLVPMGTGYKVPDSVTVVGNGDLITDPVGIERAREGGMLLEQQAPEVQAQFTTANEQTQFRGDAATNAERERINRGEIANAQAIQDRSAFDDAEPVEVFTTEELKNSGVPELVQLGTQLEASGYTEYSTDQDVMVEPSTGRVTLQPKAQEAPVEGPPAPEGEPVGTPLEALTPQKIRDMEGQTMFAEGTMSPTLVANEMQRQKITEVPDGTMLVVDAEGNLSTPAASETAPQGSTIILYGGESTRPDPSILGSPMEAVSAVGDLLDASRRKAVELTSGALTSKPVEWWVENVTSPVWNALLSDEAVEHFMTEVYPTITAPIAPLALQSWIANNPEKVAEVEQNGWDADDDGKADYTGDEAIWEAFIDEQPAWARVLYDLEMDPLNWATGGGNVARIGARELLTNPNVTRRISGEALDVVGKILRSPDVAVDKIIQGTGLAIKNTLGTVPIVKLTLDTLTSPTVQSAVSRATRPVQQATEDVMAFLRQAEGGAPPAGTTPTDGPTPPPIGSRPPTDPRSPTGGTINDLLNQVQRETDLATSGAAPRSATRDPLADIESAAEQAGVPGPPEELFPRRTPREATDLPGDNPLIRTQNAADQAALDVTREQQGPRTIADMIREASEFGQRQAPGGPSVADPFEGTTLGETIQQAAEEAAVPQRPDWEFASPQDGAGRMVDEVFAQRQAHAREVAEFTRVHDPKARRFLADQRAKRQRSMDTKAERGGQWDREHSRQEVIDEGRYIVDEFIPDFQATMRGTDAALPEYKFRQEARGNGNLQNQTDEYLLEQLSFGPDRYTRGIRNILRDRIANKGDATLQRYWDEAEAIRTKNQNLRSGMEQTPLPDEVVPEAAPTAPAADVAPTPEPDVEVPTRSPRTEPYGAADVDAEDFVAPVPEPEAPVDRTRARAESRYQRLPIAEVRETTNMSDEALEAVGLFPSQFRRQKFSEQTADSIHKRKRVNMPPVQVMRGTDGELYVLDGHSRLEGLRRRGDTDVDVQIVEGTRDELEEAAKTTNLSTTTHGPMGYADRARELADEGMSYDEIARELRQGNENWGKAGKQKAIDYHSAAFLPEDLATMFDQGTIPLNQAGELGRAIQDDVMTPAELQSFYTNVVVPEKLNAVDIRGEIARAKERKAGTNITGQMNALGFTDEELGSSGFWQGRAEEARIHKLIRKEEQNVRKWDERAKRPGTKLSASQKVDRQQSINRIAELRRELEPAPVESVAPALPPTIDDILKPTSTTSQAIEMPTASRERWEWIDENLLFGRGKPGVKANGFRTVVEPANGMYRIPGTEIDVRPMGNPAKRPSVDASQWEVAVNDVVLRDNMSFSDAFNKAKTEYRSRVYGGALTEGQERTLGDILVSQRPTDAPARQEAGPLAEYIAEARKDMKPLTANDIRAIERGNMRVDDTYIDNKVERVIKGYDANGDPRYGYPYSPETFYMSSASGKLVRKYITLPSGARVHPDEVRRVRSAIQEAKASGSKSVYADAAKTVRREVNDRLNESVDTVADDAVLMSERSLPPVTDRRLGSIPTDDLSYPADVTDAVFDMRSITDEAGYDAAIKPITDEITRLDGELRKVSDDLRRFGKSDWREAKADNLRDHVNYLRATIEAGHRRRVSIRAGRVPESPSFADTPEPADVMRDSDAQPLFFQNDPKRGARNMFERTPGPLKVLTKPAPRRSGAPQAPNRFVARDESALSTTEFSGVQIGQHNWRILNERFSNGDTYGDRWLKHVADVKDEQVARQADLSADAAKVAELTDAEAFEKAAGRVTHEVAVETLRDKSPKAFAAYQDEFTRLTTRKKDPIKDEWVARLRAFNHATANDSWWITRKYDYLLGMIREVILNNPITVGRYGLVNMLGNSVSAMLNDQPEIIGRALSRSNVGSALRESAPNEFVTTLINDPSSIVTRMFKYGHAQVDEPMTVDGVMSTIKDMGELPSVALHSPTESFAARMELGPQRHGVNTILRDQTTESVENPTKWANMVDSMRLGRHKVPAGTGGKVTGWIATRNGRDLANAMDVSFRTATWQSTMAANVAEGRTALRDLMLQDLPRGADRARFDTLWDQLPAEFGPTRIREDFAEFGTNYADRMARDWTNAIGKMDENAREQVRRIFFSGDLTTADAYASRLILFHFWASRATPMYMKQLASHPGYMNAYIKLMESLEEQAQSGQYGKSVDGLLWLMKTPIGFNLFGRPDALFQTILSFGTQGNDFSPEGESGVAAWMRNSGLYFNPLIDFAFNMAGYQGDTFAPDPLALYNQRNLVITAWDLMKAHGWVEGDMPTPDMQAEFLTWMRSHTSGMLPGTVNIPDTDTTLYAQQQINYLIQDVAEERGLDPVGPEAVAAMNDPESELYQEAFRRYADAGGLRLAMKILPTSVLYPRLRIARPDEIRYELTDPNITEERKDELYDQRAVARAGSNESRNLEVQQDEYYDLGTPEQQEAYSTYEDIRQGTLSEPVTINGVRINGRVLEDLSDDERSNAADLWASQNGQTENVQAIRDERKAYRESHPEYDGFVKWRSDVYDNPDGVLAWWQDTVEGNPNAERWLESLEPLPQDELTRELTSIEAYMQWSGIRPTTYDADPLATRDMSSVPYSATEGSGDGGQQFTSKEKDPVTQINDQLTGYQQDMALYDSQVAAVFGQPVSMQNLPPNVRSSYEMILADHGIRPPSLGTEAGDYIRWRNAQRPGTDTSVNAYVNWQQQWMGNTNAVPATTTTTTPP